jgi:hypothetical protein
MLSPSASLASLLAFCESQARIERIDYFDPRFPRPDEVQAWRNDCAKRTRARKLCFAAFPGRLKSAAFESLVPGDYGFQGRLSILSDGSIDYTSGQYSPLEIYPALLAYLEASN